MTYRQFLRADAWTPVVFAAAAFLGALLLQRTLGEALTAAATWLLATLVTSPLRYRRSLRKRAPKATDDNVSLVRYHPGYGADDH